MKILVTGAAGFIGSHLCESLLNDGHIVYGIDNLSTGYKTAISHLISNPNFEFIHHDVIEPINLLVDQIYSLASPASPQQYQKNPVFTTKTNILGSINMLELALKNKARVLLTSTSEVYGDPLEHPQKETYRGNVDPTGPRSCFIEGTEILTKNGWKDFKNINYKDEIATLNPYNKELEYNIPTNIIKEHYNGDIYEFKNNNIDLSVTPNHKMYIKNRNSENYELLEAFNIKDYNHSSLLKQCKWTGIDQDYFYFPEETLKLKNCKIKPIKKLKMDDWLEFMGYYLTEGCVYLHKKKTNINGKIYQSTAYKIQISQSEEKNPEIFNKIKNCLIRLGIKHCISKSRNCYFVFSNKQIATYLLQFGKSKDKFVPKEFLMLSKRQLKILYQAMIDGDAAKKYNKHISNVYYSSSTRLMDDMQEILLKIGYYGNIKLPSPGRNVNYISCIESEKNHEYPNPIIKNYHGFIYCVNVPNHIICVRKNGKYVFCGNCYDESKRCAETLFFDYHRNYNVDIRVVRFFNVYGERLSSGDGRVISNFICQALKNDPITVYGSGRQTRSFMYIEDAINGLKAMMNNEKDFLGPVNLGNPIEFTIHDLAEQIIKLTNSQSKIIYRDLPKDDPKQRKPDISLAKKQLNWSPTFNLNDGLLKTIEYFKKELK